MTCKECGGNSFDFDERLGERVCNTCGLVNIEEIFERTESQYDKGYDAYGNKITTVKQGDTELGSKIGEYHANKYDSKLTRRLKRVEKFNEDSQERTIMKGIRYCWLISSEYTNSKSIRDQIFSNYKKLIEMKALVGSSYEERAGAIVLFTLKENGISVTIKDVARKSGADKTRIHKLARKVARIFCRPWVLSQTNHYANLEKICLDANLDRKFMANCCEVLGVIIPLAEYEGLTMSQAFLCGVVYITARLTNTRITTRKLADVCNLTDVGIRNNVNNIIRPLGITKAELNNITIEEFVSGAICGRY
jgi:transcription initiation factor TFIIIB Brf1 subunit/transcription initiation factor TFIIB